MTTQTARRFATAAIFALLCVACTSDQITATLELAVNAALAVVPAIQTAADLQPDTQNQINAYLAVTRTCLDSATSALENQTTPAAVAASSITGQCSGALAQAPQLPGGTPSQVVAAVSAVSDALTKFLETIPSHKATAGLVFTNSFFGTEKKPGRMDRKRLKRIRKKLDKLHPAPAR